MDRARNLSKINKEILLAYLHFLHMTEHLPYSRTRRCWAYQGALGGGVSPSTLGREMTGYLGNLICNGIVIFFILFVGGWQFFSVARFFVRVVRQPNVIHPFPWLSFAFVMLIFYVVGSMMVVMVLDAL